MKVEFRKNIIHFKEIESTNSVALDCIKDKSVQENVVIITDFQKNGAGQREKSWESERGMNLLMSVILTPNITLKEQFQLSIFTSLAICDLLNETQLKDVKIKWPNDILIRDKKVAGILIQKR